MSKGEVAILVVLFDLLITWTVYLAMLALKPLQQVTEQDVNGGTLSASDFTVVLSLNWFRHEEKVENLRPILWAWVESVLAKERKQDFTNHQTNMKDREQNNVFNINLGLYDFGYLKYQEDMGYLLHEKKKLTKKMEIMTTAFGLSKKSKSLVDRQVMQSKIDKNADEIKKLQTEAVKMLEKVKQYKERKSGQCVYAYIQFDSMNGKEKFLRAYKIGAVRRCVLKCEGRKDEISHKYLGKPKGCCSCGTGEWPELKGATDPSLIQWKNLGIGKIERCFRTFAVYVASIIFIVLGFIVIVLLLNWQD